MDHPNLWHEKLEETDTDRIVKDQGVTIVTEKANYVEVGTSRCNGDEDS